MPNSTTTLTGQTWCLDPGPLLPLVARFTDHLAGLGHTKLTVGNYGDAARHFVVWLQRSGIAVAHVDVSTCAGFANHQCRCPGIRRSDRVSAKYARRASRFVRFLSECGVVGSLALPDPAPVERHVALLQAWLRQHRGIAERTIDRHGRMIARLQVALGTDPAGYTAASIRKVVLDELRGTSVTLLHGPAQWRSEPARRRRLRPDLTPDAHFAVQAEPRLPPPYSQAEAQGHKLA